MIQFITRIDWLTVASRVSFAALILGSFAFAGVAAAGQAVDILALSMSALTLFISTVVLQFSERHMRADAHQSRYALLVACFVATLLVLAWAPNIIAFALAWLVSGAVLANLVGHVAGCSEAMQARRRCNVAFAVSNVALLGALALLYWNSGSLELGVAAAAAGGNPQIAITASLLILIAAMARSALPPFSGWLLGSMSAPTPVSALMHGGFVNAGGFLLIRFGDVLQATPIAQFAAIAAGLLAAIYGTGIMLVRADVKGVLAGSTVAQMGFLVLSCGLGAYGAALWHIIGHALFKSWLFLNAGSTIGLPVRRDRAEFSARTAVLVLLGASAAATVMYLVTPLEQVSLVGMFLALMTLAVAILAAGKTRWVAIALVVPLLGMSLLVAETLDSRLEGPASHQMPIAVPIAIAAVIAIGWIVQQRFAARGLPRPLYLVLLNAGVLHAR